MTNKQFLACLSVSLAVAVCLASWCVVLSVAVVQLKGRTEVLQIRLDNLSSRVPPHDPPPDAAWKPTGMFDGIGPPKRLEFTIE